MKKNAVSIIILLVINVAYCAEEYVYGIETKSTAIVQIMCSESKPNDLYYGVKVTFGTSARINDGYGVSANYIVKTTLYNDIKDGGMDSTMLWNNWIQVKSLPTSYAFDASQPKERIVLPWKPESGNPINALSVLDLVKIDNTTQFFTLFDFQNSSNKGISAIAGGYLYDIANGESGKKAIGALPGHYSYSLGSMGDTCVFLSAYAKSILLKNIGQNSSAEINFEKEVGWARSLPAAGLLAVKYGDTIQLYNNMGKLSFSMAARKSWIMHANTDVFSFLNLGYSEIDEYDGRVAYCPDESTIAILDSKSLGEISRIVNPKPISAFKMLPGNYMAIADATNRLIYRAIQGQTK